MNKTFAIIITAAIAAIVAVLVTYLVTLAFGFEFNPGVAAAVAGPIGAFSALSVSKKSPSKDV